VKIVHDVDAFSTALADEFNLSFSTMGGRVLGNYAADSGKFSANNLLSTMNTGEVPAMYYVVLPSKAAESLFASLYDTKYRAPMAVNASLLDSHFAAEVYPAAAEGTLAAKLQPFPNASPYGADSMNLLFAAIDKVVIVSPDGTLTIGRNALRNALSFLSLNGQTGLLLCGKYGDCAHPTYDIFIFKGNAFVAFDKVTLPSSLTMGARFPQVAKP
jgi:hypothetical protein